MKRKLIGLVPVDSAAVVIADPAVLEHWEADRGVEPDATRMLCERAGARDLNDMHRYKAPELPFSDAAAWVAHASKDQGAVLGVRQTTKEGDVYGMGVAVATGVGDGLYPVYADIVEESDLAGVDDELIKAWYGGRVARIVIDCGLFEEPTE